MENHQLTMKLLIDNNAKKVLFAEANKDVVDFLFSLLAMPVGTIIKLLTKEGMVGCIGNIYKSVDSLSENYIQSSSTQDKALLLDPKFSALPNSNTLFLAAANQSTPVKGSNKAASSAPAAAIGFVKGVVTYTIMDDLNVTPMSTISSITLLNSFKVKDVGSLAERTVILGMEEGLELLKASFQSKTVLTDVFLSKKGATKI